MASLRDTLIKVMQRYATDPINGHSYFTSSADGKVLTVVTVAVVRGRRVVDNDLVVHLVDDGEGERLIIERDANDKPLVDALIQAGIPRHQVILAYAGEAAGSLAP